MTFAGGPVAWILIVMAVVAVVTYIERLVDIRRSRIDYQDFLKGVINVLDAGNVDEALAICEETAAPVANVVATAIRNKRGSERALRDAVDSQGRAETCRLDRRLAAIAIIAQAAPLIGLLGTVIGFVKTVLAANASEMVSRADLLGGAMEALQSTALGLLVAIPAMVMYGSLKVRLERMTVELEAAASQILAYMCAESEAEEK